ncbi:MAG: DUF47 family protein [Acidimicrobiia bacterium]
MKFRLIPRNESFFPLFIESSKNVLDGAEKLNEMIEKHLDNAESMMKEIKTIEKHGDECTKKIIKKLQHSFVTPFDREDIHELAEGLDDILDEILNVADILVLHVVEEENEYLSELSKILLFACGSINSLMGKLSKFNNIEEDLESVEEYRRKARKIYRKSVSHLFSGDLKSFDVLKLKDVNESLREAIKQTDRVADIVESIHLKHS